MDQCSNAQWKVEKEREIGLLLLLLLGDVTRATNAKVAVFSCPFDSMNTETKGTVLINTAEELKAFSKGEETLVESVREEGMKLQILILLQQVKAVADAGCTVVVTGGKVGEMALHFLNKYKIMTVRQEKEEEY